MKMFSFKSALLIVFLSLFLVQCKQQESTSQQVDLEKEKAAIMAVIQKETESYFAKKFEDWKSTYLQSSRFRRHGYWEGWDDKVRSVNGFDALVDQVKYDFDSTLKSEWDGCIEERSNENLNISNNMAWYTFEGASYQKDTRKLLGKALGTRVLEKVNGEWKIAYLGYHFYPQKDSVK